ncbi:carbon storage regulator [Blastopirellula marina]|uniref:Translational regulator CsrA n=1 Tax=Blastopirellula marina TaxID=124 RepID=A0A2S8F0F1_9BACT|nr:MULTISPECIES: carbon storage regulator [Pirellulaceae]PQO25648.1 carbon storage regulator [Blastopirellula marina]RCS43331.1 carbon storage regulator [Bremerella cremea]
MLVLSRKASQTIQIGTDVTLTVLGVSGNTVRLGIEAPIEVPIRRGELRDESKQPSWGAPVTFPNPIDPTPKPDLQSALLNVPASVIHVP